jgi:hypothetical protein
MLGAAMLIPAVSLEGQTTVSRAPAIDVSIGLQKEKVPVDESPYVFLRVENLTVREITISEPTPHVEGEKGELPMKALPEIITDGFQPRIPTLKTVVYVPWTIPPKDSSIHKYQLGYFFDLSHQGRYTVYMEVMDPSSHKWLRTNSAKFEMRPLVH